MKILLIIKTDNSFSNGIRILESLERLGHEVFVSSFGKIIKDYCDRYKKFKPDFIFQTGIGFPKCNLDVQRELKNLGAKLVMWYPDAYWLFQEPSRTYFLDAFNIFDLILTTMRGHVEVAKPYTNKVVWKPHYFDPTFFKSDNILTQENDVIFIGGKTEASPQREEYLESIIKKGYKLSIVGHGFNKLFNTSIIKYAGEHIADYYKRSKIGLNIISGGEYNYKLQFSVRVYQVMGSGCFLLTEYIPGIEELFIPGKHLDVFHTKEEMLEKIDYYLEHEEEREKIALEGQREVFDKYTIDKSVKRYLSVIQERFGL